MLHYHNLNKCCYLHSLLATVITARDELAIPEENPDIKLKVFF